MKKYKLEPSQIHLVNISENMTLFLHTETLQIYPRGCPKMASSFLDFKRLNFDDFDKN